MTPLGQLAIIIINNNIQLKALKRRVHVRAVHREPCLLKRGNGRWSLSRSSEPWRAWYGDARYSVTVYDLSASQMVEMGLSQVPMEVIIVK